jgi:hypothetical protein
MNAPTTDRGGIQQAIRALHADGWRMSHVWDGEEGVRVETETQAVDAIEATGEARLHLVRGSVADGETAWVFFVLGNDPDEVICDYTTNLACIEALQDTWF